MSVDLKNVTLSFEGSQAEKGWEPLLYCRYCTAFASNYLQKNKKSQLFTRPHHLLIYYPVTLHMVAYFTIQHPQLLYPGQPLVQSLVHSQTSPGLPFLYKCIHCLASFSSISLSLFFLSVCIYVHFEPPLFLCEIYFHWMEFLTCPNPPR